MDINISANNGPVNFFIGGGKYITNNFNMQIIDTSNPNVFEELAANNSTAKSDEFTLSQTAEKSPNQATGPINFFTL